MLQIVIPPKFPSHIHPSATDFI